MGEHFVEPEAAPVEPVEESFEPEESAWSGPSQEEWGQFSQGLNFLLERAQAQEPQSAEQGPGFDLYDDDAPNQIVAMIEQAIDRRLAPVNEWHQQQQEAEGRERLIDVIADDVSRNGEFLLGDKAQSIVLNSARDLYPDFARRYGEGDRAAEAAIAKAAANWREAEKALAEQAVQQHMNRLTDLSGANREPGGTPVGAQQVVTTPGGDELSLVRKYGGIPT